jgi:hypothetical protein
VLGELLEVLVQFARERLELGPQRRALKRLRRADRNVNLDKHRGNRAVSLPVFAIRRESVPAAQRHEQLPLPRIG